MKKTLLALAVAAMAASSANATVIYAKDGTKIDLDGRLSLQISNEKGKRSDLVDKGSRVRVRAFQNIGGGFEALGAAEIRFTKDGDLGNQIHTKRLFAGVQHKDYGTLTFGKQLVQGDAIGLADYTYELGAIVKVTDAHDKAISFTSAEFHGFKFGADYLFGTANKEDSNKKHTADAGQGFNLAAFYNRKFGDFVFKTEGGYGEITKGTLETDEYKAKLAGAAVEFGYGPAAIAFDWARARSPKDHSDHGFKVNPSKVTYEKLDQFNLGAKYDVTKANTVYAQYLWGTAKDRDGDNGKFRGWFLGADHKFNKNVAVYVEGGKFKTKTATAGNAYTTDKDSRIALGARVMF